jgi:hypothetical protein
MGFILAHGRAWTAAWTQDTALVETCSLWEDGGQPLGLEALKANHLC